MKLKAYTYTQYDVVRCCQEGGRLYYFTDDDGFMLIDGHGAMPSLWGLKPSQVAELVEDGYLEVQAHDAVGFVLIATDKEI